MLDFEILREQIRRHDDAIGKQVRCFEIKGQFFDFNRRKTLVGVVNLSQDSWYRESVVATTEEAIERGVRLIEEGADIVDVGAESTLPHAARADVKAQIDRLIPVVKGLAARGILVSVESYHPEVLDACAAEGAAIFNLTGTQAADDVFDLARRYDVPVILCYVQGPHVRAVRDLLFHDDMTSEVARYFEALLRRAEARGVYKCFVDPGLGFYYRNLNDSRKRVCYQMNTFLSAFRLHSLGYPTFNILPHAPEVFQEDERRAAEPFFSVLAMLGGTHVIRSHEIRTVARIREVMSWYP